MVVALAINNSFDIFDNLSLFVVSVWNVHVGSDWHLDVNKIVFWHKDFSGDCPVDSVWNLIDDSVCLINIDCSWFLSNIGVSVIV